MDSIEVECSPSVSTKMHLIFKAIPFSEAKLLYLTSTVPEHKTTTRLVYIRKSNVIMRKQQVLWVESIIDMEDDLQQTLIRLGIFWLPETTPFLISYEFSSGNLPLPHYMWFFHHSNSMHLLLSNSMSLTMGDERIRRLDK